MGFAGLYETWCDPSGGEIDTACIVTTSANSLAARVHDRMPAILEPRDFAAWLDVDGVGTAKALALLKPAPSEALELVEIGSGVNRVANDSESLQQPVAAPIRASAGADAFLILPAGARRAMRARRRRETDSKRTSWPSEKSRREPSPRSRRRRPQALPVARRRPALCRLS